MTILKVTWNLKNLWGVITLKIKTILDCVPKKTAATQLRKSLLFLEVRRKNYTLFKFIKSFYNVLKG